jgi:nicotinamide mononucleotide adenylyltransferase
LLLIKRILRENDKLVVCIGSAQKAEPFTIKERHGLIEKQLELLFPADSFEIFDLVDPDPMDVWPETVKKVCRISNADENTFYRADRLDIKYLTRLKELGFTVKTVKRKSFFYKAPDGLYYSVSSAREIKKIHEQLKIPLKQEVKKNEKKQ